MRKVYYLSSCDTCKRILNDLQLPTDFELQDIKKIPISETDLDFLKSKVGNYEVLCNKRSQLYKNRNLKAQNLTENEYKQLILEHYTFLARPVIVVDEQVFVGNATKTIQAVKQYLGNV
ncbi:putative Arsenate reductase (glutaredoxin) [Capnocytophaga canis]|uniref:arsenate reductase family protein n=1 Tax=Capnocytophaga canis TaxID=1848903 RepID=UPI0005897D1E|nr:ArsC/Spx/MgsR family protein [Capnocytophaga canis]CEN44686.1 putative Arsenate reductase (glutaredoxin) [Capnocytophaga canis]